jgi:predicted GNAT family acetyltransferase
MEDPGEFLRRAGALLEGDEARHNLILGVAGVLRDRREVYDEFRLWLAADDGAAAAALITPPQNLVLADAVDREAVAVLARAVHEDGVPVPGVVGNRPTVEWFNEEWAGLRGVVPDLRMTMGILTLEGPPVPVTAPGAARPIGTSDRTCAVDWLVAFHEEVLPEHDASRERMEQAVDRRLASPGDPAEGIWLWEDPAGAVVALAAYSGPTPSGIRVGPVYTSPEQRGRGYATALVAALSEWLVAGGRRFCFLFTDLANPTSNALYRRVGYRQVAESADYGYRLPG